MKVLAEGVALLIVLPKKVVVDFELLLRCCTDDLSDAIRDALQQAKGLTPLELECRMNQLFIAAKRRPRAEPRKELSEKIQENALVKSSLKSLRQRLHTQRVFSSSNRDSKRR